MKRWNEFILRHNKWVIAVFAALTVVCTILLFGVSVNYNMADYLPEEAQSTIALKKMEEEFGGALPNLQVMIDNVSVEEAVAYKERLAAIEGVSGVSWLDDIVDVSVPLEVYGAEITEKYYKDGSALFSMTVEEAKEQWVIDEIYSVIGDGAAAGEAADTASMQELSVSETVRAVLILVPIILLILLLTTDSWIEPLLFLASIGISVLLNMGTNIIFGEVSFISSSISPILQMAVSLDYAIFLLSNFRKYKKESIDNKEAMAKAMKSSFVVILASAATTFFGFIVLALMKFRIGADLGMTLGKGIILSLISVMVFLPALALLCSKLIDKTTHRSFMPRFSWVGKAAYKIRIPVLVIAVLLIVPCFMAQSRNTFSYGAATTDTSSRIGRDAERIKEKFGQSTPIVILVPKGDIAKEAVLTEELAKIDNITEVSSFAGTVGPIDPELFPNKQIKSQFYSENYSRIIAYANTPSEGDEAFQAVKSVREAADKLYGEEALSLGASASLYDVRETVNKDNSLVNIAAIIAIGLVILLSFKSLSLPVILLVTIETAIWINLSIPYISGSIINYIGFLVINTVQLGATVDYAILYSGHYMSNRKLMPVKEALLKTSSETVGSILVSGTILSVTGFMVGLTSTNTIVSELGSLLGRGTVLSVLMVLFFLPAVLTLCDKLIGKTTLRAGFIEYDRQNKKE